MVIGEEWFSVMNLTDGENFTASLIKREKFIINQRINFPRDTKRHLRKIATHNGILREKHDGEFIFKVNLLSRLLKPIELGCSV